VRVTGAPWPFDYRVSAVAERARPLVDARRPAGDDATLYASAPFPVRYVTVEDMAEGRLDEALRRTTTRWMVLLATDRPIAVVELEAGERDFTVVAVNHGTLATVFDHVIARLEGMTPPPGWREDMAAELAYACVPAAAFHALHLAGRDGAEQLLAPLVGDVEPMAELVELWTVAETQARLAEQVVEATREWSRNREAVMGGAVRAAVLLPEARDELDRLRREREALAHAIDRLLLARTDRRAVFAELHGEELRPDLPGDVDPADLEADFEETELDGDWRALRVGWVSVEYRPMNDVERGEFERDAADGPGLANTIVRRIASLV
jgi:hypothetical protein